MADQNSLHADSPSAALPAPPAGQLPTGGETAGGETAGGEAGGGEAGGGEAGAGVPGPTEPAPPTAATSEPFRFSLGQLMAWVTLVACLLAVLRQMPAEQGAFAIGLICLAWLVLLEFTGPHGRSAWVVWWTVVGGYALIAIVSLLGIAA